MRLIKFRGLCVKDGCGSKWVYGDLLRETYITNKKLTIIHNLESADINTKVTPETVGQLTGLVDKNGKEIYEDDILFILENVYLVEWRNGICCYVLMAAEGNDIPLLSNLSKVIIGNIHENPEIMEKKHDYHVNP